MTYEILFTQKSEKELQKLEAKIQRRIILSLQKIRIRPESFVKKLVGIKYFSLRVGDYRIILDIIKNKLVIMIITLGHRKKVYKKN